MKFNQLSSRHCVMWGAVFGMLSVILGAFAAHGLRSVLSPEALTVFDTGVKYQMYHALALLICGMLMRLFKHSQAQVYFSRAGICFIIGIFCFSGSLYALAWTGYHWFGPVTPIGGLFFILGWGMMMIAACKEKAENVI